MVCEYCNGSGRFNYGAVIDADEHTVTMELKEGSCPICSGTGVRPITNADRIRAMTDEELAKTFADAVNTGACNDWGIPVKAGGCNHKCYECILEYLNSPVEEAINDTT